MEDKTCMYCANRMSCDRYREWLMDPQDFVVPTVSGCDKYEEKEDTGGDGGA